MTSIIASAPQQFSLTIPSGATSNTLTINSVNTNNSVIIFDGFTSSSSSTSPANWATSVALTNATTITATRTTGEATTVTVTGVVIEFTSAAMASNVQTGTITIASGSATNTATINAVGSNAVVFYYGYTAPNSASWTNDAVRLDLTNSTTVTATRAATPALTVTVGYAVVDFVAGNIQSVQQRSVSMITSGAGSNTSTDTISSVTTANTLLIYNGMTTTATSYATWGYHIQLTNATTVTLTRQGTNSGTRVVNYWVLEFKAGVLNSSVQRGVITISATTSATATITPISTTYGLVNWLSFQENAATIQGNNWSSSTLTNSTTVTVNCGTNSTLDVSYEALEFTPPSAGGQSSNAIWFGAIA